MSEDQKNTPVATLREANLQANVWENQHEQGVRYNTTLSRSYQDREGQWQQTNSFGERDLLTLSKLIDRTHDRVREMREHERAEQREAVRETERQNTRSRSRDSDRGR